MVLCDKCRKYNKCYPHGLSIKDERAMRFAIMVDGCSDFKELTVEEMFGLKDGILSKEATK